MVFSANINMHWIKKKYWLAFILLNYYNINRFPDKHWTFEMLASVA